MCAQLSSTSHCFGPQFLVLHAAGRVDQNIEGPNGIQVRPLPPHPRLGVPWSAHWRGGPSPYTALRLPRMRMLCSKTGCMHGLDQGAAVIDAGTGCKVSILHRALRASPLRALPNYVPRRDVTECMSPRLLRTTRPPAPLRRHPVMVSVTLLILLLLRAKKVTAWRCIGRAGVA